MAILVRWTEIVSDGDDHLWRATVTRAWAADRSRRFHHVLRAGSTAPGAWWWQVQPSVVPGRNEVGVGEVSSLEAAMRAAESYLETLPHLGVEPVDVVRQSPSVSRLVPPTTYERVDTGQPSGWWPRMLQARRRSA